MLTGVLPYATRSPADLDRLLTGELLTASRLKNPRVPKALNDFVLRALAPEVRARYQRAAELLDGVIAARAATRVSRCDDAAPKTATAGNDAQDIQLRLKAREAP